jgi:hypothetical protein
LGGVLGLVVLILVYGKNANAASTSAEIAEYAEALQRKVF